MNFSQQPPPDDAEHAKVPPPDPDFAEEQSQDGIDDVVPSRGLQTLPMVGLGGSAGSIQALTEFFRAMPCDTGMAFVVILHLSPTHQSSIAELLGRVTSMPVLQAEDRQKVQANHVYVIPPAKYLAATDDHLQLTNLESDRGRRMAVDLFFRSLADTHGPNSAAIILSGADGDGAIGIKRIKERGGLTIAQNPEHAEYPDMPRAAIDTGMVDWVLEVSQMPKRLLAYRTTASRIKLPPEDRPPPAVPARETDRDEAALREVLQFLRRRTARDFSCYKRATILRRIARRMQVNGIEDLPAYLEFLRTHPGESGALLQDLLISVTNFFRDREAFEALGPQIDELLKSKTETDSLRVWVPACATGEEAYSIAIMLLEHAAKIDAPPDLQVFASDLDEMAIRAARVGHYPEAIAADVSEERLRRYFMKVHNGFQVRRDLREMVLFATHDLLRDAPFSRMDLISCRNLLIYLNRDAQQQLLETFHFAMKPEGRLFLGSSEAIDDNSPLFQVVDKKHRIYVRRAAMRIGLPVPTGPSSLLRAIEAQEAAGTSAPVVHGKRFVLGPPLPSHEKSEANLDRASLADLHLRLVERIGPPSVVVNADYEVVHLSEHAGKFLELTGGRPTMNLLQLVSPTVRAELRAALFRAAETLSPVKADGGPIEIDGQSSPVNIRVSPAQEIAPGYLLVTFEPATSTAAKAPPAKAGEPDGAAEPLVRHLERELELLKGRLRDTVEQNEASTEELKASNEELQAMNEELRSATEELETSREELQSINEELTTVNLEMRVKVDELAHANSDLQNLMASTSIATIFLDRELSIKRYTPSAAGIFNLISGDVGRPLAHLRHRLAYPELISDAEHVLRTLVPIEREVSDEAHWYLARMQPYRKLEDRIGGVVLTLVDISEIRRATEAQRESEERLRLLIESAKDFAIFSIDPQRKVRTWNPGARAMFGYSESEIVGRSADILFTPEDRAQGVPDRELRLARSEGRAASDRWQLRKDGTLFFASGSITPMGDSAHADRGFVKIIHDLTETKRSQESLREHMHELTRFNAVAVGREARMIELKKEINDLRGRLGEPPRYAIESEPESEQAQQ